MKLRTALLTAVWALGAWAADSPRISYSKSFPGSVPAYFAITVERTGAASYNESEDPDNAEKIQLETSVVTEMFELADRLEHFKKPLESGLKVVNMGEKTLRWEAGGDRSQAKFNYSTTEDAKPLSDRFERIAESTQTLLELRRAARHDRLGVNASVLKIQNMWNKKHLGGTAEFLPLVDP